MKNASKLFGIIILAMVMIFAMTACNNNDDTGNKGDSGNDGNNTTPPTPPVTTSYTVAFNVNGGSGTAPTAQTVNAGTVITIPDGSGLSKSGSNFGGWNTDTSGTGINYSAGASYTVTGNITLYAKWNAVGAIGTTPTPSYPSYPSYSYTVTFNVNGGDGTAPAAKTVSAGSSITLPDGGGLSKTGYTFGGWNTKDDGSGTNYNANSSYTPTGNITLYAKWIDVTQAGSQNIEYYRVDQHGSLVTTSGGAVAVAAGATLTITAQSTGFSGQQWYLNGVNTGQSGNTYNFSSATAGKHTVGLFVTKDGRLYNTNIIITVQ